MRSNSIDGRVQTNLQKIEEEDLNSGTLDENFTKKKRAQRSASEQRGVGEENDQDSQVHSVAYYGFIIKKLNDRIKVGGNKVNKTKQKIKLYTMEKNKLVDSLKNNQMDLQKYLENLQLVRDKDAQALGLLHQALMTAAKAKQREKSQRIMKEIK